MIRSASRSKLLSFGQRRRLSTSFADLFRNSVASVPLKGGETVVGHVVGFRKSKSATSQFRILDFGLKTEVPFSAQEVLGMSSIGDELPSLILALEDDFNEPVFDPSRKSEVPVVLAERYKSLAKITGQTPHFLHGRISSFKRGGASVKVLGFDAFSPRHHLLAIKTPVTGSYYPFYLLSMASSRKRGGSVLSPIDVHPVVSSYGGILFSLANLVGFDDAWEKSGEGSARDRLAYLRLLTRVLQQKNVAVRRMLVNLQRNAVHLRPSFAASTLGERYGHFQNESSSYVLRWLDRPDSRGIWRMVDGRHRENRSSQRSSVTVGNHSLRMKPAVPPQGTTRNSQASQRDNAPRTRREKAEYEKKHVAGEKDAADNT